MRARWPCGGLGLDRKSLRQVASRPPVHFVSSRTHRPGAASCDDPFSSACLASVVSLIGCAAGLTRAGSMIRESTDLSVRTGCEFLGTIDESEKSGWDHADDRRGAMNRVRNRVAELGGDTFLVVSLETDAFGAYVQAEAYRCGTVGSAHQGPAPPAPSGREGSTTAGSGFYVSRSGHVLTNAHVVEQCREIRIPPTGIAEIVARDDASDLALLKSDMANQPTPAFFQGGRGVQPGAAIVAIGFPLRGFIASGPSVTTGVISSLAGPSNDRRLFQMTAPIHPGSSGGACIVMRARQFTLRIECRK